MTITNEIPTVVVSNVAETFADFLSRCADPAEREELILGETYHADRTLLWAGDPKLVIASFPIAHAEVVRTRLKYPKTEHAYPNVPTHYLSRDILHEKRLMEKIAAYAGDSKTVQIIPYATTPEFLELVEALRSQYQLVVRTPESPEKKDFWLRDYVDTKAGFRALVSTWLPNAEELLPFGVVCRDIDHALRVAEWFNARGEACMLKADTGESGIGNFIVKPQAGDLDIEKLRRDFLKDPYFKDEPIVVERFIETKSELSPSLEVNVPKAGEGKPNVTYLSGQLFQKYGDFCGVQVDKSLYQTEWYPKLETAGLTIAGKLQELGYAGHFDLDCIVRDDGRVFMLEINSRRTGGTHVHDFAKHFYGEDYIEKASFISYEAMNSGTITDPQVLIDTLKEFLLPINGDERHGLVITITRALHHHRFGCIAVGRNAEQALKVQQDALTHIQKVCYGK